MATTPKGVVAIITASDGHVISTATDFQQSSPFGMSIREAQEQRCRKWLAFALIRDMCHPDICKVMDISDATRVVVGLTTRLGYCVTYIPIGHEVVDD